MKYDPATHSNTPLGAYRVFEHKCEACSDRGYCITYQVENGYRNAYREPCPRCKGDRVVFVDVGPELKEALKWFKEADIPTAPLTLPRVGRVEDMASYLADLTKDCGSDNVYVVERREDELLALYQIYGEEAF